MNPTLELRNLHKVNEGTGATISYILQQKFEDSEGNTEWRDVETVEEKVVVKYKRRPHTFTGP